MSEQRGGVTFGVVELSRVIPAHVKRVTFKWVHAHFSTMGPGWRRARANMKDPADDCGWCGHKFEDGEQMALGGPEKGKNMLLCQTCLGLLKAPSPPAADRIES